MASSAQTADAPPARKRPARAASRPLAGVRLAGTRTQRDAEGETRVTGIDIEIESRSHGGLAYMVLVAVEDGMPVDAEHVAPEGSGGPICDWTHYGHVDCRHLEAARLAVLLSREAAHVRSLRTRHVRSRFGSWYLLVIERAEALAEQYRAALSDLGYQLQEVGGE